MIAPRFCDMKERCLSERDSSLLQPALLERDYVVQRYSTLTQFCLIMGSPI